MMNTNLAENESKRDYLAEYDAADEKDKYPLVQQWMKTEPLPFFAQLRVARPILVTPECTLIACYKDVVDMLSMPKVFTVALYKSKMGVTEQDEGYLMAHDDDALHYREKSIMQGFLNRDDLPTIRQLVGKHCQQIIEKSDGKLEVVNHYCRQVPALLVQEYFGLDGVDTSALLRWSFWNQYDAFHNQPFDLNSAELNQTILKEHNKVSAELSKYIAELLVRKTISIELESLKNRAFKLFYYVRLAWEYLRRGKPDLPRDDMTSRILKSHFADEVSFGFTRKGVNVGGLLIGSIETTSQAVSQTLEFFINQPDKLKQLRSAASEEDTYLFDAMVWEALRFVPISPYLFRQASMTCRVAKGTYYETEITKGTNVLLLTQSAMFDSFAHDNPNEFQPNRNWYHHFNFGFGAHECLGKYVGMVMIPEMIKQLIKQPNLRANAPINYKDGPFPEEYYLNW